MVSIAQAFPWSHAEILDLPAAAAFHYAMRAEAMRWQRIDDMLTAANFHAFEPKDRRQIVGRIAHKLSGPGRVRSWQSLLNDDQRARLAEWDAERDQVYQQLAEAGLLCQSDGTKPIQSMLKRSDEP